MPLIPVRRTCPVCRGEMRAVRTPDGEQLVSCTVLLHEFDVAAATKLMPSIGTAELGMVMCRTCCYVDFYNLTAASRQPEVPR